MRGLRQLSVALAACLALACGSAPATPSPSQGASPGPSFDPTPGSTAAPSSPTPRPASEAVPGELSVVWESTGCSVAEVAPVFESRLVAVGFCRAQVGDRGIAWETDSGFEWRRVFEAQVDEMLWAVSTDGRTAGALIGGWDGSGTPQIWRGDIFDGFDQDEPAALPIDLQNGMVHGIEWGDGDYLSVGSENDGTTNLPAVWRYVDTGPWTAIEPPPEAESLVDVIYGPDPLTYTVTGTLTNGRAAIWRLSNGTDWTLVAQPAAAEEVDRLTLLDAHTVIGQHAIWDEDEDGEWRFTPLLSGIDAYAGVVLDDGVVVFGVAFDSNDDPEVAVLAAGPDRHWVAQEIDPSDKRKIIRSAVLFDDRVIAAGDAVWMGPDSIEPYLR